MEKMKQLKAKIRNIVFVLSIPAAVYIVMEMIVYFGADTHLLNSVLDVRNLLRDLGISTSIAFGLSLNLASGRFDLSLGAQRLVGTIIGGNIAVMLGFNGVLLLVISMLSGLVFGFIVGMVFITFRVPPVVLGIGMALIYESLAFAASSGQGLQLFGVPNMGILVNPAFTLVVLGLIMVGMYVLFSWTKFRYELNAVQGSQKIAHESGVNIFRHVVICYTLAGALVSVSGVFNAAFTGSMTPTIGLTSNGAVVAMCFPMFIGNYLARRSNMAVGILMGTLALKFFVLGLTALKLPSALQLALNMFAFIGFLVFLANQDVFKIRRARHARIKEAAAMKLSLGRA